MPKFHIFPNNLECPKNPDLGRSESILCLATTCPEIYGPFTELLQFSRCICHPCHSFLYKTGKVDLETTDPKRQEFWIDIKSPRAKSRNRRKHKKHTKPHCIQKKECEKKRNKCMHGKQHEKGRTSMKLAWLLHVYLFLLPLLSGIPTEFFVAAPVSFLFASCLVTVLCVAFRCCFRLKKFQDKL